MRTFLDEPPPQTPEPNGVLGGRRAQSSRVQHPVAGTRIFYGRTKVKTSCEPLIPRTPVADPTAILLRPPETWRDDSLLESKRPMLSDVSMIQTPSPPEATCEVLPGTALNTPSAGPKRKTSLNWATAPPPG
jgi:hypothetical protein